MKPGPTRGTIVIKNLFITTVTDTHTRPRGLLRQVKGAGRLPLGVVPKKWTDTHDDVDSRQLCLPARSGAGWGWCKGVLAEGPLAWSARAGDAGGRRRLAGEPGRSPDAHKGSPSVM